MSIEYKKEFFSTLKDLSKLSAKVLINKADGLLKLYQITEDKSINFVVTASESNFNFPTSEVAFHNFSDFYSFLELFSNPILEMADNRISISDGTSKTEYVVSNPMACQGGVDVKWTKPNVRFELSQKELETLTKASSLLVSSDHIKKARIHGNGESCTIELVNVSINPARKGYDKTFSREFKVEKITEAVKDYDFLVNRNFFTDVPKKNYTLEINQVGAIRAGYKEDDINVNIFCTAINERG